MKQTAYKHYLLIVLLVTQTSNYTDGVSLGLLLQSIKDDLRLADTQLGLLTGIAFALFYSVMGIPIARWADRGNRVKILALSTALWSVMVALCGTAVNFVHLLLIRVGVAVVKRSACKVWCAAAFRQFSMARPAIHAEHAQPRLGRLGISREWIGALG